MRLPPALTASTTTCGVLGLVLLGGCGTAPDAASDAAPDAAIPTGPLPSDSVYQLPLELLDQDGRTVALGHTRGHPTVVSMFYASCPSACPTLISDIKAFEAGIQPQLREDLRVVLVSFDPVKDTPAALDELATTHDLDRSRWTLSAPVQADQVRTLSTVLGISYRQLDSGHFNHSALIILLDAEGRPVAQVEGLNQSPDPLVAALRSMP